MDEKTKFCYYSLIPSKPRRIAYIVSILNIQLILSYKMLTLDFYWVKYLKRQSLKIIWFIINIRNELPIANTLDINSIQIGFGDVKSCYVQIN